MTRTQKKLLDLYCALGEAPMAQVTFWIRRKGEVYQYTAKLSLN